MKINKRITQITLLGLLLLIGVIIYFQKSVSHGQNLSTPSQRATALTSEKNDETWEKYEVDNECFKLILLLSLKNLKFQSDDTGCTLNASFVKPKALFSVSVRNKSDDFIFEELPGLVLRRNNKTYQPQAVSLPTEITAYTYRSDQDLVTFIWQPPYVVTISIYDFANFDQSFTQLMEGAIASLKLN